MSREIKFRAWDNQKKSWITEPVGFTMSVADGKFHVFGFNDAFADMYQIRVELQQFTGLKDKNGVDIYEGDIVDYVLDDEHFTMDIEYVFQDNLTGYDLTDEMEPEVIGNIHENPEVLGGQNAN